MVERNWHDGHGSPNRAMDNIRPMCRLARSGERWRTPKSLPCSCFSARTVELGFVWTRVLARALGNVVIGIAMLSTKHDQENPALK
jgi:hypothetical protein